MCSSEESQSVEAMFGLYMKFQSWQVSVWSQVYVCIRLVHWACDELTFHIHCYKSAGFSIVSYILRMLFGLRMKISFWDEWKLIGRYDEYSKSLSLTIIRYRHNKFIFNKNTLIFKKFWLQAWLFCVFFFNQSNIIFLS